MAQAGDVSGSQGQEERLLLGGIPETLDLGRTGLGVVLD